MQGGMHRSGVAFGPARFEIALQSLGILFEKCREVGEHIEGIGAEMMLDAFDIVLLGFSIEAEQRKKSGEGLVPFLDLGGNGEAFFGEDEAAVLLVVEVAQFPEFLDHAGDGGLFDLERSEEHTSELQ